MPHTARTTSHTSTEQWQSFEIRMRHRRADRCVVRAEAALEAGLEEEARTALAEARALNPQAPEFEALSASVRERQAAMLAEARRARTRRAGAVAVLCATVIGATAFWLTTSRPQIGERLRPAQLAEAATPVQAVDKPRGTPAQANANSPEHMPVPQNRLADDPVQTSGIEERAAVDAHLPAPASDPLPTLTSAPLPHAGTGSSSASPLPAVEEVSASIASTRTPPEPPADARFNSAIPQPRGADGIEKDLPAAALPVANAPAATEHPPASEPVPSDDAKVRVVLARFEAAYSSLNASAAQSVWPSVDERSLQRAFNSLESQRVSLGRCSVSVSGPAAQAECAGTATWTPKVGGGRRTEARHWQFDLASVNGSWHIVRAIAR